MANAKSPFFLDLNGAVDGIQCLAEFCQDIITWCINDTTMMDFNQFGDDSPISGPDENSVAEIKSGFKLDRNILGKWRDGKQALLVKPGQSSVKIMPEIAPRTAATGNSRTPTGTL